MTIAHKTKSIVPSVFKQYGPSLCITNEQNKKIAEFELLTNAKFKRNIKGYVSANLCVTDVEQLLLANLRIAKKQIMGLPCVICGEPDTTIYHIKHVRKTLQKKQLSNFNYCLEVMGLTNYKTISVCSYHYKLIHSGKYDDTSLKTIFKNFKNKGIGFDEKKRL